MTTTGPITTHRGEDDMRETGWNYTPKSTRSEMIWT